MSEDVLMADEPHHHHHKHELPVPPQRLKIRDSDVSVFIGEKATISCTLFKGGDNTVRNMTAGAFFVTYLKIRSFSIFLESFTLKYLKNEKLQ